MTQLSTKNSPTPTPSYTGPRIPILFESESLLVLNKPTGVPSVPHTPDETGTAVNFILSERPELLQLTHDLNSTLVHRLDNGTSGVLVFAKIKEEYEHLRQSWKSSAKKKTYRALTSAKGAEIPFRLPYLIDFPLGHSRKSSKRMLAFHPHQKSPKEGQKKFWNQLIRGKPLEARTRLVHVTQVVTQAVAQASPHPPLLDWTIQIETGVMHQIRCHMASLGFPLLGDVLYSGPPSERLWLHASTLQLLTQSGQRLSFEAPLPSDWPIFIA